MAFGILVSIFLFVLPVVAAPTATLSTCAPAFGVIERALNSHITVNTLTREHLRKGIDAYFKRIDPYNLLLTKGEREALLAKVDGSNTLVENMIRNNDFTAMQELRSLARERLASLFSEVVSIPEKQELIELRSQDPQLGSRLEAALNAPMTELAERRERILDLIAERYRIVRASVSSPRIAWLLTNRMAWRSMQTIQEIVTRSDFSVEISSILKGLDPFSDFWGAIEIFENYQRSSHMSAGIGANLKEDVKGFKVANIFEGSPLPEAGVQVGDLVTHINDHNIRGADPTMLVFLTSGVEGRPVKLQILRDGKTIVVETKLAIIRRASQKISSQSLNLAPGLSAYYIKLQNFYTGAGIDIIEMLKDKTEDILILDLRFNGGGKFKSAMDLLSAVKNGGPGPMVHSVSTGQAPNLKNVPIPAGKTVWNKRIIVMVNEHSGSASELVAITLQDYLRAIIVGSHRTFGKGSGQTDISEDPTQYALRVTNLVYYGPSGRSPNIAGVSTDIPLRPDDPSAYTTAMFPGHTWVENRIPSVIEISEAERRTHEDLLAYLRAQHAQRYPQGLTSEKGKDAELEATLAIARDILQRQN